MLGRQVCLFKVERSKFRISLYCDLALADDVAERLRLLQSAKHLLTLRDPSESTPSPSSSWAQPNLYPEEQSV